jgi:UDP-2,3-diacylglucosamine pyrophosphatase LpxH
MTSIAKRAFVISDLHLGGALENTSSISKNGFRIMTRPDVLASFIRSLTNSAPKKIETELVINGDFIDFLAEEHKKGQRWLPFIKSPKVAVTTFERIVAREGNNEVFDALKDFVSNGHSLTVLLGNHDIELSLPAVRQSFQRLLGSEAGLRFRFLYDGEAHRVGQALIEHGNRYDPANMVNHDGLRRIRSLQSRRQYKYQVGHFKPPAGSLIVTELVNPIKTDYPFIDLLKPESEPLFAILLALEPRYEKKLDQFAKIVLQAPKMVKHRLKKPALPHYAGDIAKNYHSEKDYSINRSAKPVETEGRGDLYTILCKCLSENTAADLLKSTESEEEMTYGQDISASSRSVAWRGLAKLIVKSEFAQVERQLKLIQDTLRALDDDHIFDEGYEVGTRYVKAAFELSKNYTIVVFGHTHKAKHIKLKNGATYLNSGTWANLMRFPKSLFNNNSNEAFLALKTFFQDLKNNQLDDYIEFKPHYVRLDVQPDGTTHGELFPYESTGKTTH